MSQVPVNTKRLIRSCYLAWAITQYEIEQGLLIIAARLAAARRAGLQDQVSTANLEAAWTELLQYREMISACLGEAGA
jgi:hypothetical protein